MAELTGSQKALFKLIFKKDIPPELLPSVTRADSIKAGFLPRATAPSDRKQALERVYEKRTGTPADSTYLGLKPRAQTLDEYDSVKELKQKVAALQNDVFDKVPGATQRLQDYMADIKLKGKEKGKEPYTESRRDVIQRMIANIGKGQKTILGTRLPGEPSATIGDYIEDEYDAEDPETVQKLSEFSNIPTVREQLKLNKAFGDTLGMAGKAEKFGDFYGKGSYTESIDPEVRLNLLTRLHPPGENIGKQKYDKDTGVWYLSDGIEWKQIEKR